MIAAARWRKYLRGSDASLLILVQVQAGPPAFAALPLRLGKPVCPAVARRAKEGLRGVAASARQASGGKACHAVARRAKAGAKRKRRRTGPYRSRKRATDSAKGRN